MYVKQNKYWEWQVEMYKMVGGTEKFPIMGWVIEKRYYMAEKSITDFDLHGIKDKRRNSKFLGIVEKPIFKKEIIEKQANEIICYLSKNCDAKACCDFMGNCIYINTFIYGSEVTLKKELLKLPESKRFAFIIKFLEKLHPPKVTREAGYRYDKKEKQRKFDKIYKEHVVKPEKKPPAKKMFDKKQKLKRNIFISKLNEHNASFFAKKFDADEWLKWYESEPQENFHIQD